MPGLAGVQGAREDDVVAGLTINFDAGVTVVSGGTYEKVRLRPKGLRRDTIILGERPRIIVARREGFEPPTAGSEVR